MRELLFRGIDKDSKWVFGSYLPTVDEQFARIIDTSKFGCPCRTVWANSVGQFTGQTDMAGNKIFEGDILEAEINQRPSWNADGYSFTIYPKKKTYWVVEWHDHYCESGFMTYGIDRRWHRPLTRSRIYNAKAIVVGNIHDNPELMKREK